MDRYVYDGLRSAVIDTLEVRNIATNQIRLAEYDNDWRCWTIYEEDCDGDIIPLYAEHNEHWSKMMNDYLLDCDGETYSVTTGEILSQRIDMRMDDNFSDFELFGSKLDEVCYDSKTDLHYHRITVKTAGDGYVTTIYAIDDDGNYMEYTGEIARSISEGHEWDLVSIS